MQIKCKKQRARVQDKISTERIGRDFLEISIYEFTYSRYGFLFANKSKSKTQKLTQLGLDKTLIQKSQAFD